MRAERFLDTRSIAMMVQIHILLKAIIYAYVYRYTHAYVNIYIYVYIYIHIYKYVCVYTLVHDVLPYYLGQTAPAKPRSTMTQRGTCFPAPVSEKKVLKASLAGSLGLLGVQGCG